MSDHEPSAIPPLNRPDAGRLEALLRALFPLGAELDLGGDLAPVGRAHLRRVALEDGGRPAFRWCVVAAWHPVDYFPANPAASIWEIEVIPVIRADGAISPHELGGCARTHRQAVVRLCGQFATGLPGAGFGSAPDHALLAHLLECFPAGVRPGEDLSP